MTTFASDLNFSGIFLIGTESKNSIR